MFPGALVPGCVATRGHKAKKAKVKQKLSVQISNHYLEAPPSNFPSRVTWRAEILYLLWRLERIMDCLHGLLKAKVLSNGHLFAHLQSFAPGVEKSQAAWGGGGEGKERKIAEKKKVDSFPNLKTSDLSFQRSPSRNHEKYILFYCTFCNW